MDWHACIEEEQLKTAQRRQGKKAIDSWKGAGPLFEQRREEPRTLTVELRQPRVIDTVPIDFVSGEPAEREGKPTAAFRGQLIYFTNADRTLRRPSGAILVIDRYEVKAISDGRTRFEPR